VSDFSPESVSFVPHQLQSSSTTPTLFIPPPRGSLFTDLLPISKNIDTLFLYLRFLLHIQKSIFLLLNNLNIIFKDALLYGIGSYCLRDNFRLRRPFALAPRPRRRSPLY
jgi:hypothetical protein